MKLIFSTLAGLLLAAADGQQARAQVGGSVGIGTTQPSPAAVLDLAAPNKGLLIPRLDSAARVAIAAVPTGLLVFQTSPRQGFYYYDGTSWLFLPDKGRAGDNLGSHRATRPLDLQNQALVGAGDDLGATLGLGVRADGGLNAGQNTTGGSVYLGYLAGMANTSGTGNTFLGRESGHDNTSGSYNTFSGFGSGYNTLDGTDNTFSGYQSGILNEAGSYNTFSGSNSGYQNSTGNNNTFSGYSSGDGNTTGSDNTFGGFESGLQNQTGSGNVFLGSASGQVNATGSLNVALGFNAGPAVDGLVNTVALGAQAQPTQSNTVVLGHEARVGIGTTEPAAALDVNGSLRLAVRPCPVNQPAYTLSAADLRFNLFRLGPGNTVGTLTLPPAGTGQADGQELVVYNLAAEPVIISGANTDNAAAVTLAGHATPGLHGTRYVWDGRWVRLY